jgi:hypothetical protein
MSRTRALAFAASLVVTVLGAASAAAEVSDAVREALDKGNEAARQRQWIQAGQYFKTALDADDSSPEVLLAVAKFSDAKGGRDLVAIAAYHAYLAAQSSAPDRDQILARIDALEKRVVAASRSAIERALSTASGLPANDRAGWLTNIAVAQAKSDDLQGALSTASSARAITSPYSEDPYGQVANALAQINELGAADEVMRRVEQSKRSSAYRQLSFTVGYAKKIREAQSYASQCSGTDRISAYSQLAKVQSDAGDQSGARSSLNTAIDAMRYLDQNNRKYQILGLAEAAAIVGDFDSAKRLYADGAKVYNSSQRYDVNALSVARGNMAEAYAKWGRFDEANALAATVFTGPNADPGYAFFRPSMLNTIARERQNFAERQKDKAAAQIKEGKLAELDALLSKEPPTQQFMTARLALASAYMAANNLPAVRKLLEPTSVALSKATVADFVSSFQFAQDRIQLSGLYIKLGDLAASRRILDATAGTIAKLTNADQKQYPIDYLVGAYADLAGATAATKNFTGAKAVAVEGIKLAMQAAPNTRVSAMAKLSSLDERVGIGPELAATLPSLPESYSKDNVAKAVIKYYISLGQEANAVSAASRISNLNDRTSALSSAMSGYLSAKNWAKAMALTTDPGTAGRLLPEIARSMVNDNKIAEAVALEPRFTAGSREADNYFSALASQLGSRGDANAAVTAALRIVSVPDRVSALLSVARGLYPIAGRAAAQQVVDRAQALAAELKTPPERYSLCNSNDYSFTYEYVPNDNRPDPNLPPQPACIGEALAIPDAKERMSPLGNAISSTYLATRPIFATTMPPLRPVISRALVEANASDSRDYNLSYSLTALATNGAVETSMDLAFQLLDNKQGYAPFSRANDWLTEIGDQQSRRRLVDRLLALAPSAADQSAKDSLYSNAVSYLGKLGEFDEATRIASDIQSASSRTSAFTDIANQANSQQKFDVALNNLDRAVAAEKLSDYRGENSSFPSIAIQASHKNAEAFVETYVQNPRVSMTSRVYMRDRLLTRLIELKQYDRAAAVIPALEADLAQLTPAERQNYRGYVPIAALATLGDTARLNNMLNAAPQPEDKIDVLIRAASGFIKAEKPDSAKASAERAEQLAATVSDPQKRSNFLLSVVSIYNQIGNAEAARRALNSAVEIAVTITDAPSRAAQLRSVAGYQARAGDVDAARKAYVQSLEITKISRPDAAGWIDASLVGSVEGSNPELATRMALAIADPQWRTFAIVTLASNRQSRKVDDALAILREAQPNPAADIYLERLVKEFLAKKDYSAARDYASRIFHPGRRDRMRRTVILAQARVDNIAPALADMAAIQDKTVRAYTFIDLGAFISAEKGEATQQNAYFAQLCNFEAIKLADTLTDPLVKADLLTAAGMAQNQQEQGSGASTLAKAKAAAGSIADERARVYALRWIDGLKKPDKPDASRKQEIDAYTYRMKYPLSSDMFQDLDAHIDSFQTSNPTDRLQKLTNISTSFAEELRAIRKIPADLEQKRNAR